MIIAAYAGCGKTFLARNWDRCTEVNSMSYARFLDDQEYEDESCKADLRHTRNPLYPYNMIPDILKTEQKYPFVVIPADVRLINLLQRKYKRRVVTAVPDISLQEEYRQRYLARGNTRWFCRLFADRMQERIEAIKKEARVPSITLNSNEYLSDYIDAFETFRKIYESDPVLDEDILNAEQLYQNRRYDWYMYVFVNPQLYVVPVRNVGDPLFRKQLLEFGKWYYQILCGYINFTKEAPFDYDDRIISAERLDEIKEIIIHSHEERKG